MNPWDACLKATDSRTGKDYLVFSWEKEILDDAFLIEPCSSEDFFRLCRERCYYGLLSS